jgi:predicted NodU family carbamoyl transferase
MQSRSVEAKDIDAVSFYFDEANTSEEYFNVLASNGRLDGDLSEATIRNQLKSLISKDFADTEIRFNSHHMCHAVMAAYHSGFDRALVAIFDGNGETASSSFYYFDGAQLCHLRSESISNSLGHFYTAAIRWLGYEKFDEYKVMGLAPYGSPDRFKEAFSDLVTFGPEGTYRFNSENLLYFFKQRGIRNGFPADTFSQYHMDFAASIQDLAQKIVQHQLQYWKEQLNCAKLCLAGGVAQNCSINSYVASTDLFTDIYVHPSSHDGGAAIGAALMPFYEKGQLQSIERMPAPANVSYVGSDEAHRLLVRHIASVEVLAEGNQALPKAADCLLEEKILGWADGYMEFGPRALGRRSILADPRSLDVKETVNRTVKHRENYRPFAPIVLIEHFEEWFTGFKTSVNLDAMVFNVKVKEDKRQYIPAVTHIDGTARVQVVSPSSGSIYQLVDNFFQRTMVPIVLNTSFNVKAEPIVCSAYDAFYTFMFSPMKQLYLGSLLLQKRDSHCVRDLLLNAEVSSVCLEEIRLDQSVSDQSMFSLTKRSRRYPISSSAHKVLAALVPGQSLGAAMDKCGIPWTDELLCAELENLANQRVLLFFI